MHQRRGRPGFLEESLSGGRHSGHARQHGFECDQSMERGIVATKDDAHATLAQHRQDSVGPQPADLVAPLGRRQAPGHFV
jgi:hypothetical protein